MSAPLVLAIVGSARPDSHTMASVRSAAEILRDAGARPVVWELAARPLPFADPVYHGAAGRHPDPGVRQLAALAVAAHGFLLATPAYHGSYSGVLKNCLDHLDAVHFHHRPVGLVAHGETLTAVQACEHLRSVVRGLYGLAVPEQLVTVPTDFTRDSALRLTSPAALKRLGQLCDSLLGHLGNQGRPAEREEPDRTGSGGPRYQFPSPDRCGAHPPGRHDEGR